MNQKFMNSEQIKKGTNFFQENNGNYSSMRLMSFIALIASIWFGSITITQDKSEGIYITSSFLIAAFAPKAIQKFAETKLNS